MHVTGTHYVREWKCVHAREMWVCIYYNNDSGTVLHSLLETLPFTFHLTLTTLGGVINPHFTGEKTAVQKKLTCPKS